MRSGRRCRCAGGRRQHRVFPHFLMDRGKPGMLAVDRSGERFVNETTSYHLFGLAMQAEHEQTNRYPPT